MEKVRSSRVRNNFVAPHFVVMLFNVLAFYLKSNGKRYSGRELGRIFCDAQLENQLSDDIRHDAYADEKWIREMYKTDFGILKDKKKNPLRPPQPNTFQKHCLTAIRNVDNAEIKKFFLNLSNVATTLCNEAPENFWQNYVDEFKENIEQFSGDIGRHAKYQFLQNVILNMPQNSVAEKNLEALFQDYQKIMRSLDYRPKVNTLSLSGLGARGPLDPFSILADIWEVQREVEEDKLLGINFEDE